MSPLERSPYLRLCALVLFVLAAIGAFTSFLTLEQELGLAFIGLACLVVSDAREQL